MDNIKNYKISIFLPEEIEIRENEWSFCYNSSEHQKEVELTLKNAVIEYFNLFNTLPQINTRFQISTLDFIHLRELEYNYTEKSLYFIFGHQIPNYLQKNNEYSYR